MTTLEVDQISSALQLVSAKQYEAAEEQLKQIPSDSPSYPKALRYLARSAHARRDFSASEDAARRFIEISGETEEALQILGISLRMQARFPEAVATCAKLLKAIPPERDRRSAYKLLAICLEGVQDKNATERTLRDAISEYPGEADFHATLAIALMKSDRREEAGEMVAKALVLDPKNLRARGLRTVLNRPPTKQRARWVAYPGQITAFGDAKKVIRTSLLRGYPERERFISPSTRILTLGSCFASNLARALQAKGFDAFSEFIGENVNSTYANRYFLKWVEDGVQDETGELMQAAYGEEVRLRYLEAARACNVFVFTLGLAPSFFHRETGQFFFMSLRNPASANGVMAGYEMRTTNVEENVDNLREIINTIQRLSRNKVNAVLTVSPVPLAATTEMNSAVIADCLSKSTLRLACEQVRASDTTGLLHYWPSFEIVRWLGPHFSGAHPLVYGHDDNRTRHVSQWLVNVIIELFLETYSKEAALEAA
jgi:tetratricopeptide (TPR) repeat protein